MLITLVVCLTIINLRKDGSWKNEAGSYYLTGNYWRFFD